jgi:hypothetical protein
MLNCTWDDLETKMVLSRIEIPLEERHLGEQHKLQNFCQNLREEYLKRRRTVRSVRVESPAELNRLERPLEEQSFYQNRFGALRLRRQIVSAQP